MDNYSFDGSALAKAEITNHRLLYLTPNLARIYIFPDCRRSPSVLAANKAAANLSVWLVSLPWEEGRSPKITDNIITRGWADPQNHSSLSESEALVPGEFYTLTFNFNPTIRSFPKDRKLD